MTDNNAVEEVLDLLTTLKPEATTALGHMKDYSKEAVYGDELLESLGAGKGIPFRLREAVGVLNHQMSSLEYTLASLNRVDDGLVEYSKKVQQLILNIVLEYAGTKAKGVFLFDVEVEDDTWEGYGFTITWRALLECPDCEHLSSAYSEYLNERWYDEWEWMKANPGEAWGDKSDEEIAKIIATGEDDESDKWFKMMEDGDDKADYYSMVLKDAWGNQPLGTSLVGAGSNYLVHKAALTYQVFLDALQDHIATRLSSVGLEEFSISFTDTELDAAWDGGGRLDGKPTWDEIELEGTGFADEDDSIALKNAAEAANAWERENEEYPTEKVYAPFFLEVDGGVGIIL